MPTVRGAFPEMDGRANVRLRPTSTKRAHKSGCIQVVRELSDVEASGAF